jgi:hypothetical protein
VEFRQAHIRRQCQLQASGGGKPLGGANAVRPAPPATIDRLGTALDNLALAAANDTTVLQQLTSVNLALTATNTALTAANKKLLDALAKLQATKPTTPGPPPTSTRPSGPPPSSTKPYPGNNCWTHGHRVNQMHTSATCGRKAAGNQDLATASNTMGGSEKDKGWDARCT